MVCQLQTPLWTGRQVGLKSAVENVTDGYIVLNIADAIPTIGDTNYYNIYYSLNVDTLFDFPQLVTLENQVSIPATLLSLNYYIAVRTAQLGISDDISSTNMTSAGADLVVYPSSTELTEDLDPADGYIVVEDATGYPKQDGYVLVGNEVILYSDRVDDYTGDGYDGLLISNRDPYSCNDVVSHTDGYSVELFKGFEDDNSTRFKASPSCMLTKPDWPGNIGLERVSDLGIGTSVKLEWKDARFPAGFSIPYYNIYRTDTLSRLLKFGTMPVAISTGTEGIIPGLVPGSTNYFAVKASYQLQNLSLSGFDLLSANTYAFPPVTTVQEGDGYWTTGETGTLTVASTEGYPLRGFLHIGSEIMEYNSITSVSFNIVERDVFAMELISNHPNDTQIYFFRGIEDTNRNYYRTSPTWDAGQDIPLMPLPDGYNYPADGYGGAAYNQDLDGYRANIDNDLTEDHSAFEADKIDDILTGSCGYHRENWDKFYTRSQCGTYSGGRRYQVIPGVNGGQPVPVGGGHDVWEHATRTEEDLLGKVGNYFVLLRRKWTGKRCAVLSSRTEHPGARCLSCFGTTFQGGYDRYVNSRDVIYGQTNPNGFIMAHLDPYDDDLELSQYEGLKQSNIMNGWTISIPTLKDRDILIKYIFDIGTGMFLEEFRYEVLKVNRNKLLYQKNGKQTLTIKRLDRTKEIYKFSNPASGPLLGVPVPPGS